MARRLTEADVARGRRLTTIRDALRLTQDAMVERLNTSARVLGLPARYRYYTVSRMESGSISFEDAAVWLALDPLRRGWDWFVLGKEIMPTIRGEAPESDRQVAGFPPKKRRVSGGHRKQA
jgi:transcriptional regulator with XRE-family HTH domain